MRVSPLTKVRLDAALAQRREDTGLRYSFDNLLNEMLTLWESELTEGDAPAPAPAAKHHRRAKAG